MRRKINVLFLLGLLIPAILVFRSLILSGPAVWGDAPYFYPEGLRELFNEPFSWISRGHNFGGVNEFLWIYPLMIVYGSLHNLLGFGNDEIIRILFYFPAIVLSLIGPVLLAKHFGYPKIIQFFAALFYTFNTYFILLIDGGQVGVALAYGIFPLSLIFLLKFLSTPSYKNFLIALAVTLVLGAADLRVLAISFLVAILLSVVNGARRLLYLILLLIMFAAVDAYWIFPFLISGEFVTLEVSGLQLVSLLNSLLVFQPHWPGNEFGKVSPPPFYFIGVPLLIFIGLIFKKTKLLILTFTFLFLISGFLAKGNTHPGGAIYDWFILNLPFGSAFRDSTKFFMPLTLFGGILIGNSVELLTMLFKKYTWVVIGASYAYLLFLVHPAILGNLNGVLKLRDFSQDFQIVHERLKDDNKFFRIAWFPVVHPFTFQTEEKPSIDASQLVNLRPFASMNVGTDIFNFVYQSEEFLDWLDLLGVKYLIFSGNPRVVSPTLDETKSWEDLISKVGVYAGLARENWETTVPIYKIEGAKPHLFAVDNALVVLGGEDIYQKLRQTNSRFSVSNQVMFFLEDGKFDPNDFTGKPVTYLLNGKDEIDLLMSFLQKYFISPYDASYSQWAARNSRDYLKWRYELLNLGVDTKEFDYEKGVAFSTISGEKIIFEINVPNDGEYIYAQRTLTPNGNFKWDTENLSLKKGSWKKEIINEGGLKVINVIALIPKKEWDKSLSISNQLVEKEKLVRVDGINDSIELERIIELSNWHTLDYEMISPVNYKVNLQRDDRWIVFTDTFSSDWSLKAGKNYSSLPAYSEFNAFYVGDQDSTGARIHFGGQEYLDRGLKTSLAAIVILALITLGIYSGRRKKARNV